MYIIGLRQTMNIIMWEEIIKMRTEGPSFIFLRLQTWGEIYFYFYLFIYLFYFILFIYIFIIIILFLNK